MSQYQFILFSFFFCVYYGHIKGAGSYWIGHCLSVVVCHIITFVHKQRRRKCKSCK